MHSVQTIHCPNCGSSAERHHLATNQLIRTQCPTCDYLMITCARTGNVVEAYAPGIAMTGVSLSRSAGGTGLNR